VMYMCPQPRKMCSSEDKNLTPEQRERFARHIIIPEIGETGQSLLATKKVTVVGCGGLGTPVATYLAGSGVGALTLIDQDTVALSNLPRQVMYTVDDIGKEKAVLLSERLKRANPDACITPMVTTVTDDNVDKLIEGSDLVVSCLDNLDTRYIINSSAVRLNIPMIEGAIQAFTGLITVVVPHEGPCYECIFPRRKPQPKRPIGVAAPVPGAVGCIQAIEALKLLLGIGQTYKKSLVYFDFLTGNIRRVSVSKNPSCPVCSTSITK
jgi:molybdopterin/thiamine biosynthesis adenylyltransferase